MEYHVVYLMPNGTKWGRDVIAANDADILRQALAGMPNGAVLDAIELPEAA